MQGSTTQRRDTEASKAVFKVPTIKPRYTDEEIAAMAKSDNQRRRCERVSTLIREAGGRRYADYRFETYKAGSEKQKKVLAESQGWAENYVSNLDKGSGLILHGPVGTGKDHLLFAAVRQAILQHDATVTWQNGRDLFGEIRDRIGDDRPERQLVARLEESQVLVLSDPVSIAGALSPYQADMLYRVVENRYAAKKITCATLNIKDDTDADDKLGAATWDRLLGGAVVLKCDWGSFRQPVKRI